MPLSLDLHISKSVSPMNKNKALLAFLAIGTLVKFFLMTFSFHGDLAFIWAIPATVKIGNVFNFYKDYSQAKLKKAYGICLTESF